MDYLFILLFYKDQIILKKIDLYFILYKYYLPINLYNNAFT